MKPHDSDSHDLYMIDVIDMILRNSLLDETLKEKMIGG